MDFNPYHLYTKLYTQIYTQKYSHLTLEGQWLLYNIWQVLFPFKTTENSRILEKYKRFWV